jgi:hypothetical protein
MHLLDQDLIVAVLGARQRMSGSSWNFGGGLHV